ncbi:MAG: hypothetical protein ACI3T9_07325, partial [Romboutsia timonensis]
MKDILVKMFETKEVKVSNDGNKVNLVDIAKCCGLIDTSKNTEKVRWNRVKDKLNLINNSANVGADEINNVLTEIDEANDRNSIYVSSWLAKRLATECH